LTPPKQIATEFRSSGHGDTARQVNIFNILAFSSSLPEHLFRIVVRDSLAFTEFLGFRSRAGDDLMS